MALGWQEKFSFKDMLKETALGFGVGGIVGGATALFKGQNFFWGNSTLTHVSGGGSQVRVGEVGSEFRVEMDKPIQVSTKANRYSVYEGVDPNTGEVKYVGITKRAPEVRWAEHRGARSASNLRYRVVDGTGKLGRNAARVWEQNLINQYGGPKGGQLLNKINSISPKKWAEFGVIP